MTPNNIELARTSRHADLSRLKLALENYVSGETGKGLDLQAALKRVKVPEGVRMLDAPRWVRNEIAREAFVSAVK
jgi:hypothetical protein